MTTTLREMLDRRANDAGHPNLDPAKLVGLGERRLRRRRIAAVAGSAAVAAVVVVAFAFAAALNAPLKRGDGPPVIGPSPSPTVRQLLYVDVARQPPHNEGTFHFGDRVISSDDAFVFTDVTDNGFVYTSRDDLWFTDGESPVQIGSRVCGLPRTGLLHGAQDAVITGDVGSLVAWLECEVPSPSESTQSQTLVAYDTASRREVVREPMSFCGPDCELDGVIGEHIYFTRFSGTGSERRFIYDTSTATGTPTTSRSYADEVRNNPRALVLGDTWETATVDDPRRWEVHGTQLVPIVGDVAKDYPTTAFNTATHQAVQLHLPPEYHPNGVSFEIFEWLDNDTVALTPEHNLESADIITCRLSDGHCQIAVTAGPGDTMRLMPGDSLPG